MKLTVNQKIFETYPSLELGVVVLQGFDNCADSQEISALLRAEEANQAALLSEVELPSLPEIKVWRETYKSFGSDPRDHRSSVEALLRRARAGNKPLPNINPLVDLYNYIALKYHLPVGAEDLGKISGDLELTFAEGWEKGICLGSDVEESCYPGEVVYRDKEGFVCRRWNWREAGRTKIDTSTTKAVTVIERLAPVESGRLSGALEEFQQMASKILGGDCKVILLDSSTLECVLGC